MKKFDKETINQASLLMTAFVSFLVGVVGTKGKMPKDAKGTFGVCLVMGLNGILAGWTTKSMMEAHNDLVDEEEQKQKVRNTIKAYQELNDEFDKMHDEEADTTVSV